VRCCALLFAICALMVLATLIGCCTDLQRPYAEAMERTRIAIEMDTTSGRYKTDATSRATLNAWRKANREALADAE